MTESVHKPEDCRESVPDACPASDGVSETVVDVANNPVDEVKIAELLLEFERENDEISLGYPYWRRGIVWAAATAIVTELALYMLYAGSAAVMPQVLGTATLTLAVWVGTTFLPVKA